MANHKCFSLVDLLHRLHCMVLTMSHRQTNLDGFNYGIRFLYLEVENILL